MRLCPQAPVRQLGRAGETEAGGRGPEALQEAKRFVIAGVGGHKWFPIGKDAPRHRKVACGSAISSLTAGNVPDGGGQLLATTLREASLMGGAWVAMNHSGSEPMASIWSSAS